MIYFKNLSNIQSFKIKLNFSSYDIINLLIISFFHN